MIPAMLKMSEKPRNYHFLLNQSMLGLRKNSTITAFQQIEKFTICDLPLTSAGKVWGLLFRCASKGGLDERKDVVIEFIIF